METLFNQIQEWIAEGISWLGGNIDEDYGQLDMLYRDDEDSDTYPLTFPLVLVDLPEARWDTFGGGVGQGAEGFIDDQGKAGTGLLRRYPLHFHHRRACGRTCRDGA